MGCCNNPKLAKASVGWRIFKGNYCLNCETFEFDSRFLEFFFLNFLAWLWSGIVLIEKK